MNNMDVDDVLQPKRQAELVDLVSRMAKFKPTRVAIECDPSQQAKWNQRYAAYRAGSYTLTRDERDQVGLRLAATMKLAQVDCVDFTSTPPGLESDYDFADYAKTHGQQTALDKLMAKGHAYVVEETAYLRSHPLVDWYRRANEPERLKAGNSLYFDFAAIGGGDAHPGAAWVGGWHARNLIIVENVRRLSQPGDRIFMIFGAGHGYLLHAFAEDSGAFTLVDPQTYLR